MSSDPMCRLDGGQEQSSIQDSCLREIPTSTIFNTTGNMPVIQQYLNPAPAPSSTVGNATTSGKPATMSAYKTFSVHQPPQFSNGRLKQ